MLNIKTGLVSVTFRKEQPETILDWVLEAGLEAIEWGGDIHVPPGDIDRARRIGSLTRRLGLIIPTYGSYYRAGLLQGQAAEQAFDAVMASAVQLGAAGIRVWAHQTASGQAGAEIWAQTLADLDAIRHKAAREGLDIYLEYHNNTLNDRPAATRRLLSELAGPAPVKTFWQPLNELSDAEKLQTLAAARPALAHVHVFANQGSSCLLETATAQWQTYLPQLLADEAATDQLRCLMLEFVQGESREALLQDARTLNSWLTGYKKIG